jgi:hypothetical protein
MAAKPIERINLNDKYGFALRVHGSSGHAGKRALALLRQCAPVTYSQQGCHGGLIPDFFEPIELYLQAPNLPIQPVGRAVR